MKLPSSMVLAAAGVAALALSGSVTADELIVVDPESGEVVGEVERDGRFDRRRARDRDRALEDIADALEDMKPERRPIPSERRDPAPINRDMPVIQLEPKRPCRADGACRYCYNDGSNCVWLVPEDEYEG